MTLLFEQKPTDRWKVVEHPSALPGECFLCRGVSTGRDWFIDLGLDFEFHGRVYLCNECLAEICEIVGYLVPAHAQELKSQLAAFQDENYRLRTDLAAFREMEKAIGVYVARRSSIAHHPASHSGDGPHLSVAPEATDDGEGEADPGPSGGTDQLGEGAGTPPEPIHEQGVDDVRSDGGSGSDFALDI